jgi:hypothetical protein
LKILFNRGLRQLHLHKSFDIRHHAVANKFHGVCADRIVSHIENSTVIARA